jgi:hypothetical protein
MTLHPLGAAARAFFLFLIYPRLLRQKTSCVMMQEQHIRNLSHFLPSFIRALSRLLFYTRDDGACVCCVVVQMTPSLIKILMSERASKSKRESRAGAANGAHAFFLLQFDDPRRRAEEGRESEEEASERVRGPSCCSQFVLWPHSVNDTHSWRLALPKLLVCLQRTRTRIASDHDLHYRGAAKLSGP